MHGPLKSTQSPIRTLLFALSLVVVCSTKSVRNSTKSENDELRVNMESMERTSLYIQRDKSQIQNLTESSVNLKVHKVLERSPTEKPAPPSIVNIPSMAKKAGGRLKPEFLPKASTAISTRVEDNNDDNDYMSSSSSEELDCAKGYFWHIRGKRCAPMKCQFGRNFDSGNCLEDPYNFSSFGYYYPVMINMYKTSIMVLLDTL
jgi:hypothetical protein